MAQLTRDNLSYWARTLAAPFAEAFPVNDAVSRTVSPVMIVGCGRSGNTLLRSMLIRGGEVAIPPESYVWAAVARGYSRWRFSTWETVVTRVIDAFRRSEFGLSDSEIASMQVDALALPHDRRSLASILDLIYVSYCDTRGFSGRRWGDKTPFNILDIRVIERIFPAAQYVHIVRDPRAVALSITNAAKTASGIRERTFADASARWNKSVHNARSLARRVGAARFCEVRYEDLLSKPNEELARICRFLVVPYKPAMLSFYEEAHKLGDVPAHAHHANVYNPLDARRSDDWIHEISTSDRRIVEAMTPSRVLFGYS